MTDPRTRVPSGVPTGGEFATEARSENDDLAVEKSPREKVIEALETATGTHAERLRHFDGMYSVISNVGDPIGPREMIDADAERELDLQRHTERLIGRVRDDNSLASLRRALFEMHGVSSSRGEEGEFYIYSPRTACEVMVVRSPLTIVGDATPYDLLYGDLDTAANYDEAGSLEGWRKMWRHPDTKGGLARAKRDYDRAAESAELIRNLVGADYPMYVKGVKP